MLFSQRVFQKTSLPLKKARLTPALRAASTFVRCWPPTSTRRGRPTGRPCAPSSSAPRRSVSTPRGVADVVAVGSSQRTIGYSALNRQFSCGPPSAVAGGERPVVADLVGPARRARRRRGCCRRSCCRPARWCRRSGTEIGVPPLSSRTMKTMWLAAAGAVVAHQLGEVDARDGGRPAPPRGRDGPVAAVDQAGGGVAQAGRLGLRQAGRRLTRRDLARAQRRRSSPAGRCRCGSRSASVLILKWTVWPWLTLMSVAKPWMLRIARVGDLPLLAGLPGFEFSHAIGLVIGGSQGPAARALIPFGAPVAHVNAKMAKPPTGRAQAVSKTSVCAASSSPTQRTLTPSSRAFSNSRPG